MEIKFITALQRILLVAVSLCYFSTAQAQQECLDIEIDEVVTITNDECSQQVSFQLNNASSGSNLTDLILFEFFRMDNGVLTGIDASNFTVGSFFDNLNFRKTANWIESPIGTFDVGTVMNENVADITVSINQGECVDVLIKVQYQTLANASGPGVYCLFEEMVRVCNAPPNLNLVCGTLSDVADCPVKTILLGEISTDCFNTTTSAATTTNGDFCVHVPENGCTTLEIRDCESFCDDPLDARDLLTLHKYILGITTNLPNGLNSLITADVNGDGEISTLDRVFIQRKILGFDTGTENSGDCVIFDQDDFTQVDHNTISGTISSTVCDGDTPNLTVGVMGDIDGSCACDDTGNLTPVAEPLTPERTSISTLIKPRNTLKFYDMGLIVYLDQPVDQREVIVNPNLPNAEIFIDGNTVKVSFNSRDNSVVSLASGATLVEIKNSRVSVQDIDGFLINGESSLSDLEIGAREGSPDRPGPRSKELENTAITTSAYFNGADLMFSNSEDLHRMTIEIFNVAGSRIFSHYQEEGLAGVHRFQIQDHAGILLVRVTAEEGTFINKLYKTILR